MRDIFAGRNRKIIPVLPGILILNSYAFAQDLPTAKPEALGLSPQRLERIATVQHSIHDRRVAGAWQHESWRVQSNHRRVYHF